MIPLNATSGGEQKDRLSSNQTPFLRQFGYLLVYGDHDFPPFTVGEYGFIGTIFILILG
jgi:hypothetical protein